MTFRAIGPQKRSRPALWAALTVPGLVCADPHAVAPQSALQACAIITEATERLSCYDHLAGRDSYKAPATRAGAAPMASDPVAASIPAGSAPAAAPSRSPPETFGLYEAEHPAAPPAAPSLQARVMSVGGSAGRMTVELEGGQLWELDDSDPLLAAGDMVSIRRARLGSFLMETPTRRTHRVRRLR